MSVASILESKGRQVVSLPPTATIRELLAALSEYGIGGVVVSSDGKHVEGIITERDVVRALHNDGKELLDAPVSAHMSTSVRTCRTPVSVAEVMMTMTEIKSRHIPVVDDDDELIGIVSIGDVVKHRLDELESERSQLLAYITT